MYEVVGVRFKKAGKIYYFAPNGLNLVMGDKVVVETARGFEYGEVIIGVRKVSKKEVVLPLKNVLRKATLEDEKQAEENAIKEQEAFDTCQQKIIEHSLPMKLVDVEYTFDVSKIIFYFTAEGRVDFRDLVKDLASIFRTRIELRQIGVRDEAKMLGGLGSCGQVLCCHSFLGDFEPVSIKMAKEQNLSLSPNKISGICGRLMCCLKYENDFYEEERKKAPKVGKIVKTPMGSGKIVDINIIKSIAKVEMIDDVQILDFKFEDISNETTSASAGSRKQEPKDRKSD